MQQQTTEIIVIDDEPVILKSIQKLLELEKYSVHTFASAEEFLTSVPARLKQVLIVDKNLPVLSGLELIQQHRQTGNRFEAIVITAFAELRSAVQSVRLGCYSYLCKPFDFDTLLRDVAGACDRLQHESKPLLPSMGILEKTIGSLAEIKLQLSSFQHQHEQAPLQGIDCLSQAWSRLDILEKQLRGHIIEECLLAGSRELALQPLSLVPEVQSIIERIVQAPHQEQREVLWLNNQQAEVIANPTLLLSLLTYLVELALGDSPREEPLLVDLELQANTATVHFVVPQSRRLKKPGEGQRIIELCKRMAEIQWGRISIGPFCGFIGVDYSLTLWRNQESQTT